jgi:hypothetical protein
MTTIMKVTLHRQSSCHSAARQVNKDTLEP